MSIDRITHLVEQMHRSEDDLGDPIDEDFLLAADGLSGLKWIDPTTLVGSGLDVGIGLFLDHGAAGATETIDQSAAPIHWITLDANCVLTFTGAVATVDGDPVECGFRLYVETPGAFTLTFPGSVVWEGSAPDVSAAGVYILDFTTPDGGTNWYGRAGGGSGSIDVSDGTTTVAPTTLLSFDPTYFSVTDLGGDEAEVTLVGTAAGHYEVIVSGTAPPVAVTNVAEDDWLYGFVPD